ncbi:four helix bundle protein [bacterium]|nr:four helix bundle protein [bacterium]
MPNDLSERFLEFAANILKLIASLDKTATGRHISSQMLRSGTSCGANYEEACAAESRRDFVHKMQVALKELRESFYWLRLIQKAGFVLNDNALLNGLLQENQELVKIIAKSIVTAKQKI